MKVIHISNLKNDFISILEKVIKGEEFIIEYGRENKKVAMLIPFKKNKKKRMFGQLKGKIEISDEFDQENSEINKIFYESKIWPS